MPPAAHTQRYLIFLELVGCIFLAPLVSLFWDSSCGECVVQAPCGSEDLSTGVACNSKPHCPLAKAPSQVPGTTKVNIDILFKKKEKT